MKKTLSILLLLTAAVQFSKAQDSTTAWGTVQDTGGKPLHFVFAGDVTSKNVAFTDSLGNFSVAVKPGTKLIFELQGYKDTVISNVNAGSGLLVILKRSNATADVGTISAKMEVQRS